MTASLKKPTSTRPLAGASHRPPLRAEECPEAPACQKRAAACVRALDMWLRWNTAYEQVTEQLFQHGRDHRQLEELMDQMDQLRHQAARLSRDLVN